MYTVFLVVRDFSLCWWDEKQVGAGYLAGGVLCTVGLSWDRASARSDVRLMPLSKD
jgi:hypothetical protein